MDPRLRLIFDAQGYVLVWGGVKIRISTDEWGELVRQAEEIAREMKERIPK